MFFMYIYLKKTKILFQKKYMYPDVPNSIICHSQDLETIQVPINGWMDKEDIYNETLLSHKRKWNLAICDNMNGLRWYYATRNKSEKDKYCMISLICAI